MQELLLLLLPLAVLIDATAQGKLNLINRQYVPLEAQKQVNLPLHHLYPCLYLLLAISLTVALGNLWVFLMALLLRVALFDPILNWSKRDPIFKVGTSATTDKLIVRLAQPFHVKAKLVSASIRICCLVLVVVLTAVFVV